MCRAIRVGEGGNYVEEGRGSGKNEKMEVQERTVEDRDGPPEHTGRWSFGLPIPFFSTSSSAEDNPNDSFLGPSCFQLSTRNEHSTITNTNPNTSHFHLDHLIKNPFLRALLLVTHFTASFLVGWFLVDIVGDWEVDATLHAGYGGVAVGVGVDAGGGGEKTRWSKRGADISPNRFREFPFRFVVLSPFVLHLALGFFGRVTWSPVGFGVLSCRVLVVWCVVWSCTVSCGDL
jgi:hypothetical protein